MSWATQYEVRFRDRFNVPWKARIKKQGYSAGVMYKGGALYNWYALASIAAPGWHVPSAAEWNTLINSLGESPGGKLKEIGWWDEPNTGATNERRFNARGNGYRAGAFTGRLQVCRYWTSDEYYRALSYDSTNVFSGSMDRNTGASVRLIRDSLSGSRNGTYTGWDGKVYPTVLIGNQEWLAADLCETRFPGGVPIPIVADDMQWASTEEAAMCAYQNNWENAFEYSYSKKYGFLFNGFTLQDPRGFAPPGWRAPTQADFQALVNELGGAEVAGAALKEAGTDHWMADQGSTNSSGFSARGAGTRSFDVFRDLKIITHYASSTTAGLNCQFMALHYNTPAVHLAAGGLFTGYSIRLICESTVDPGLMTGNDGKEYRTVKIGNQVWMAENSCETRYRNGDLIPEITDQEQWASATQGALCSYNNDITNSYSEQYNIIEAATEDMGQVEHLNESDRVWGQVKSSRLVLNVLCRSMFALADLYSEGDMHHAVELYREDDLYWKGFVDPRQHEEAYGPVPYIAKITCTDGLTLLKDIPYEESEGVPYTGRKTASAIIFNILGKIGHNEFKEYDNLYDIAMENDLGDSPWDQTSIDVSVFTSKKLSCYEALKQLLRVKNACIKMDTEGVFCIYRPFEIKNETLYGRHFTSPTRKTPISINPSQYVSRPGYLSSFRQVVGSTVSVQQAIRKVTITQDYGNKENWITGGEMRADQFNGTNWEGWERQGGDFAEPISNYVTEEKEGVIITGTNPVPFLPFCLSQVLSENMVQSDSERMILEFEYAFFNTGPIDPTTYAELNIEIKQGNYYLANPDIMYYVHNPPMPKNPSDMLWKTEYDLIRIGEYAALHPGMSEWKTFKRAVTGIPENGHLFIKLMPVMTTDRVYPVIKNIKINIVSAKLQKLKTSEMITNDPRTRRQSTLSTRYAYERSEVKVEEFIKKEYTATNLVAGEEIKEDVILGDVTDCGIDNILGQFRGALASVGQQRRRDTITLYGNSGSALITCNGVTRQIDFVSTLQTTAVNFKYVYQVDYMPISVRSDLNVLIFTHNEDGEEFTGDTTITNISGNLQGVIHEHTEVTSITPTTKWSRRGFQDNLPLLQIIAGEMAEHGSRSRQFLDLIIIETAPANLNFIGNLQDSINKVGNLQRSFLFARGVFRIRHRIWKMDLVESLALKPLTVDTTEITADSTTITVDQTHE